MTKSFCILVVVFAGTAAYCTVKSPDLAIDQSTVFTFYRSFRLLTPTPIYVSPELAELCTTSASPVASANEVRRAGPHAEARINLYANDGAVGGVESVARFRYPQGSIIVKEKIDPVGQVLAVGGMVKRASGYDEANGNWEYFYADKAQTFVSGRIGSCVACHAKTKATDYVYSKVAVKR